MTAVAPEPLDRSIPTSMSERSDRSNLLQDLSIRAPSLLNVREHFVVGLHEGITESPYSPISAVQSYGV